MRVGGLEMFERKCCYECQHFQGPRDNEEWEKEGTEGMCPHMSWYTDAFDDACEAAIRYCDENLI